METESDYERFQKGNPCEKSTTFISDEKEAAEISTSQRNQRRKLNNNRAISVQDVADLTTQMEGMSLGSASSGKKFTFPIIEPSIKQRKLDIAEKISAQYGDFKKPLKSALDYLENQYLYTFIRAEDISHSFLLHGPKGTGKSHLAEIIAKKYRLPLISVRGSTFEEGLYGDTSKKVTALFNTRDPRGRILVLLIDEIDAVASRYRKNSTDTARSTTTAFFDELYKHRSDLTLFTFATTNYIDSIDDAVKSRFDVIEIPALDHVLRKKYIKYLLGKYHIELTDKDVDRIAGAAKNLDRREMKKALGTAVTEAIRLSKDPKALPTSKDIIESMQEKSDSVAVSFGEKFDRIAEQWGPRIQFVNSIYTIGYNFLAQPYLYFKGKNLQERQMANSEQSLALAQKQYEEAKKNRREDLDRMMKEHFERARWDEYNRHLSIAASQLYYRRWHSVHEEMNTNNLTYSEACKKLGY